MSAAMTAAMPPRMRDLNPAQRAARLGAWLLVGTGALLMIMPFYFMFVFATHTSAEIYSFPPPAWFGPDAPGNLKLLEERLPFWRNIGVSLYVALMQTGLTLFFCSLAGYAFAMYEFRFKKPLFALVMASMIIPAFMNMVPTFMLMDFIGWLDQPRALYVPGAAGALGIFLMRQYIASAIPRELVEAARVDGCGEFGIYWRVVLPLVGPAMGTLGLITFINSWNNFITPLVVMRSVENYTIPLALRSMQAPNDTEWGALMVGAAIAVLPLLIMFIISSRRLIEGLTQGAVKG
ncbi:carbohydrate ABC transporter permease [Pseudoduganella violacea]|uniref:Multiple sugar transport system permease protein n=1 Tax=Pseudoduganella violacea TaxID=1715466 RepID=A0A7W5FU56_9BURK|nr:carbohydrate ABC transporter permease [Pseudoduganella violacea]MBB3119570.1 multiple sugar transport system permease protein [Pseudoduganella violacea]